MGDLARVLDVCDRCVSAIAERVPPDAASPAIAVERSYAPDWLDPDFWSDNPKLLTAFTGRKVYVFPAGASQVQPATRGADLNEYRVAVVTLERYADAAGQPPLAWTDDRVLWVQDNVFDLLGDVRGDPPPVRGCWPQGQEWRVVYSPELLRSDRLFRSEVLIAFRKIE